MLSPHPSSGLVVHSIKQDTISVLLVFLQYQKIFVVPIHHNIGKWWGNIYGTQTHNEKAISMLPFVEHHL